MNDQWSNRGAMSHYEWPDVPRATEAAPSSSASAPTGEIPHTGFFGDTYYGAMCSAAGLERGTVDSLSRDAVVRIFAQVEAQ